tara:strand:- start:3734 stop:4150 length:417 start_codon:yes stop_codon:yes gene_type:complete
MGQLITPKTAKLAKEKGFNHSNSGYFYNKKGGKVMDTPIDKLLWGGKYPAATQDFLSQYLRIRRNIDITIAPHCEMDFYSKNLDVIKIYTARVDNWNIHWSVHDGTGLVMPEHYHFEGDNYENVFEQGLYKALELIKG